MKKKKKKKLPSTSLKIWTLIQHLASCHKILQGPNVLTLKKRLTPHLYGKYGEKGYLDESTVTTSGVVHRHPENRIIQGIEILEQQGQYDNMWKCKLIPVAHHE